MDSGNILKSSDHIDTLTHWVESGLPWEGEALAEIKEVEAGNKTRLEGRFGSNFRIDGMTVDADGVIYGAGLSTGLAFGWDGKTGELVRVETEIGHFVVKAWVTEGIKPGVVACSHHMGRWKLESGQGPETGQRQLMATVALEQNGSNWKMDRKKGASPWKSPQSSTSRWDWKSTNIV